MGGFDLFPAQRQQVGICQAGGCVGAVQEGVYVFGVVFDLLGHQLGRLNSLTELLELAD